MLISVIHSTIAGHSDLVLRDSGAAVGMHRHGPETDGASEGACRPGGASCRREPRLRPELHRMKGGIRSFVHNHIA